METSTKSVVKTSVEVQFTVIEKAQSFVMYPIVIMNNTFEVEFEVVLKCYQRGALATRFSLLNGALFSHTLTTSVRHFFPLAPRQHKKNTDLCAGLCYLNDNNNNLANCVFLTDVSTTFQQFIFFLLPKKQGKWCIYEVSNLHDTNRNSYQSSKRLVPKNVN